MYVFVILGWFYLCWFDFLLYVLWSSRLNLTKYVQGLALSDYSVQLQVASCIYGLIISKLLKHRICLTTSRANFYQFASLFYKLLRYMFHSGHISYILRSDLVPVFPHCFESSIRMSDNRDSEGFRKFPAIASW